MKALSSGRRTLLPHLGHLTCPFSCSRMVKVSVTSRLPVLAHLPFDIRPGQARRIGLLGPLAGLTVEAVNGSSAPT